MKSVIDWTNQSCIQIHILHTCLETWLCPTRLLFRTHIYILSLNNKESTYASIFFCSLSHLCYHLKMYIPLYCMHAQRDVLFKHFAWSQIFLFSKFIWLSTCILMNFIKIYTFPLFLSFFSFSLLTHIHIHRHTYKHSCMHASIYAHTCAYRHACMTYIFNLQQHIIHI